MKIAGQSVESTGYSEIIKIKLKKECHISKKQPKINLGCFKITY